MKAKLPSSMKKENIQEKIKELTGVNIKYMMTFVLDPKEIILIILDFFVRKKAVAIYSKIVYSDQKELLDKYAEGYIIAINK